MGCDIHLHTEVKINGTWQHYGTPDVDRSYALFERMAGVRGDVKRAIAAPRGLPDDATVMTQFDYRHWNGDAHSASWLNAQEIHDLMKWIGAKREGTGRTEGQDFGYLFGNHWSGFIDYPEEREPGVEDIRWIFWFDN